MARTGWYMVCYDICHPKRLGRLYRVMKKNGISAQKSVFFVQRSEPDMKIFLKELDKIIKDKEDDIRAYPIETPSKVWTTGGVLESFPLIMPGKSKNKKAPLWKRFFKRIGNY